MEKIPPQQDEKLLRYIDGELKTTEVYSLEAELKVDESLRARYHELRAMDQALKKYTLEVPPKNFTNSVMSKLDHYPQTSSGFSMRSIFLLAGVLIAAGLAAVLVSGGVFDNASTTIDLNQIELSRKYINQNLPSIPFNSKLIVNIIILLNLGLAWLVLDRAILKPLFQRRLESGH